MHAFDLCFEDINSKKNRPKGSCEHDDKEYCYKSSEVPVNILSPLLKHGSNKNKFTYIRPLENNVPVRNKGHLNWPHLRNPSWFLRKERKVLN